LLWRDTPLSRHGGRGEVVALEEIGRVTGLVGEEVGEVDADAPGADDRDAPRVAEPRLERLGVVDDVGEGGARDVDDTRMDAGGEDDADAIGDQVGVVLAELVGEVEVDAEALQLPLEVLDRRPVVLLPGNLTSPAELAAQLIARLVEPDLGAQRRERPRRLEPRGPAADHREATLRRRGPGGGRRGSGPIGDGEVDLVARSRVDEAGDVLADDRPVDARLVAADADVHRSPVATLLHEPRIREERPRHRNHVDAPRRKDRLRVLQPIDPVPPDHRHCRHSCRSGGSAGDPCLTVP
jgi:hypothetical protein